MGVIGWIVGAACAVDPSTLVPRAGHQTTEMTPTVEA